MSDKLIRFVEKIFFPLELIGIILIFLPVIIETNQKLVSGIGFTWLALIYFVSMFFKTKEGMSFLLGLSKKVVGLGACITAIGIMFSYMEFSIAKSLLEAGVIILVVSMAMIMVELLRKPTSTVFIKFAAVRGLVIAVVGAVILYFREF